MNKIFLLLVAISILGCSKDDNCEGDKATINLKYDNLVQYVKDNPGPGGIDYSQISLLNQERDLKLEQACK